MARTRNLKPGFFTNDLLAEIEPLGRLLFQGLWCIADREGRLHDRPKKIKVEILPYDDCDVDGILSKLATFGFILRYEIAGGRYIQINNFVKHQNPHHMETVSLIPPIPGGENHFNQTPISPHQRARIYARDRNQCVKCGGAEDLQIDYVKLLSCGGDSSDDNLRTLCVQCKNKRPKDGSDVDDELMSHALNLNPSTLNLNLEPSEDLPIPKPPTAKEQLADFEEIYSLYPRKVGKGKAVGAIKKAVSRIQAGENKGKTYSYDEAIAGMKRRVAQFAESLAGNAGEFTPHPATWFNQSRYFDDTKEWNRPRNGERNVESGGAGKRRAESNASSLYDALRDHVGERVVRDGGERKDGTGPAPESGVPPGVRKTKS